MSRCRVETGGGLVKEQHLRAMNQAAGNLEPPAHAAGKRAHHAIAPVGEVDQLEQALQRIGLAASGGTVVIDATELEFIDVRGLLTLDRHAAANDTIIVLRSPPAVVTRVLKLVDLIALRVEDRP